MKSSSCRKAVLMDRSDFLEPALEALNTWGVRYCVIGGTGANASAYSRRHDIVVVDHDIEVLGNALAQHFEARTFPRASLSNPD
jgi:hypothetical protein